MSTTRRSVWKSKRSSRRTWVARWTRCSAGPQASTRHRQGRSDAGAVSRGGGRGSQLDMQPEIAMQNEHAYRIIEGRGPRLRKRTPEQKRLTREKARRLQQETVVRLSDFLPRPLDYAWEDGRIGRQRWWGNLLRHAEELIDSPEPPPFAVT